MKSDLYEICDPVFENYIVSNAALETLSDGFRWCEGPVWIADMNCLLFSDVPNDRVMRWSAQSGVSLFEEPSGFANGHCRDLNGRLVTCSHRERSLMRTELNGEKTVLAAQFAGKRLNSPNDVCLATDGTLWFTDPTYGITTDFEGGKQTSELSPAVYRWNPATNDLQQMSTDFEGPNGICFSPDYRKIYIVESGDRFSSNPRHHVRVFDVPYRDHALDQGSVFYRVRHGHEDGIKCDTLGNLWISAGDGIHCVDANGKKLGAILLPEGASNFTFGDRYLSRLFICSGRILYSLFLNVRGMGLP